ncbi:uncharacterized protein Triagg1_2597 [Trichoderma aggressivum f. europaeum]|uniref:Uncharacterized protein n=1 Tax=Trichoderma aggressivum f. europaeum TaxID=173218 RepID=A0AAE1IJF9_9HYPO|nr:hypothetical protein Triagg1_2597 [Trichoderma aggressivum f. europaeum]
MYDPNKLPEYPVPVPHVNYSAPGVVVSLPHDVAISLVIVGQKRPREESDSNGVAEPDSKRPAISMGLGDVNSHDIDMSAINIRICPPGNFCSTSLGKFHVVDPLSPDVWGIFGPDDEDLAAPLRWSLIIHDIQPVSWETIRSVHADLGKQAWGDSVRY